MRPRSSLALAGALLLTLVPGTAMAAELPSGAMAVVATVDTAIDDGGVAGDPIEAVDGGEASDGVPSDGSEAPDDTGILVPQEGAVMDHHAGQLG